MLTTTKWKSYKFWSTYLGWEGMWYVYQSPIIGDLSDIVVSFGRGGSFDPSCRRSASTFSSPQFAAVPIPEIDTHCRFISNGSKKKISWNERRKENASYHNSCGRVKRNRFTVILIIATIHTFPSDGTWPLFKLLCSGRQIQASDSNANLFSSVFVLVAFHMLLSFPSVFSVFHNHRFILRSMMILFKIHLKLNTLVSFNCL